MDVVITSQRAEDMLHGIRDKAATELQKGTLDRFMRGYLQGEFNLVYCMCAPRNWVAKGIENELDNLCSAAVQRGQ